MSGSLDTSFLFETIAKDDEVNLPPDVMERELKKREARARKEAQEAVLTRKVENLEKIEKKTEKLLKKAQERSKAAAEPYNSRTTIKREASLESHVQPITNPVITREPLPRPAPSITDYHMLNRNPKKVMKFIMSVFSASGSSEKTLFIDTYELKNETGLSAESIRQVFVILKKNGYIEVERSRSNGMRMVTINDSLLQ